MSRVYNFSAGPAMLPEPVLMKAAEEMLDYNGSGMSVMEMSHRSKVYLSIIENAEALLRKLMHISDDYTVLFLQGGASQQFAMIPMNLLGGNRKVDFIHTGTWTKKAMTEAKLVANVHVAASSEDKNFSYIPENYTFSPDADYVHICTNNTIEGTVFTHIPDTGNIPLVADMSSNIMSEEIDVTKFGLIFAGAQKNLGPSGLTVVIVRNDLVGKHGENTPVFFRYETHAKEKSMYNTPPCYSIYIAGLVFEWMDQLGGVKAMEEINREKAQILYDFIDESEMFTSPVDPRYRSLMNIPFAAPNDELNKKFISEAGKAGLLTLAGHRSVGGMRASIYNAMPVEGVRKLVAFMKKFEMENK
ncbi:3-phosphoserine/phosphohydroxythreonine transaminase [Candidatus Formimonas warabiya]|uniref:Phosphoserine aminotransferase n=1 Tax=Formimonas warabiya TaxID=1761012 RepID=A0A3G1KME7_FORW1|nr:3-phosphoserine/phosphohydroxythreonine transaminase [Candidatus Formimonas warabiya]ATW23574.1 phosphoserine transaminase [Candidatus Formimonas warabiya]